MSESIQKFIDLIKQTGDKFIVANATGQPEYVIMRFADYEKMIFGNTNPAALSEDELVEKINQEVENWKINQQKPGLSNWQSVGKIIQDKSKSLAGSVEEKSLNEAKNELKDNHYDFEPIE